MTKVTYPKKFKVYTASAGAGKTFRLTLEYLKIALRNPKTKFRTILAITFTVKATNEMKARIIEACKAFGETEAGNLTGRNKALFVELKKETPWSDGEIKEKSQLLFKTILHNYGDFAVSTIDSFSQRIIRSFAYELGKPINFDIELDTAKTADYLTAQLLAKVGGENKDFTKLVVNFFNEKLKEDDSIYIEYDIREAVKIMLDDDSREALQQLKKVNSKQLLQIGKKIDENYYQLQSKLDAIGTEVKLLMDQNNYDLSDFHYGKSGFMNVFLKIANGEEPTLGARFQKTIFEEGKFFKDINKSDELFEQKVIELGQQIPNLYNDFIMLSAVKKSYPRMALLAELRKLFETYQQEEEFLLISEFNKIISEHVKGQPAPFLYEKVGERFDHILIDEFQDTSVMQWHNLVPLVVECLSKEEENESLVVGDSKQAIYRWRGGETKQLTHLPKLLGSENDPILQDSQRTLNLYYDNKPMEFNYRSKENIVQFNNDLYEFIIDKTELEAFHPIYESYCQKPFQQNTGGYIRLNQVEKKGQGEEKELYHQRVFEIFEEQLRAVDKNGYSGNDIAVLCRNNKELQFVADYLQRNSISFTSRESLHLEQEKAVSVFPSLVRLMVYPQNQILQAEIANYLLKIRGKDRTPHEINTAIGNKKMKSFSAFASFLQQIDSTLVLNNLNRTELLPLWEQYVSWLPIETQNSAYISFFRDELWEYISVHGNHFEGFLDWWEEEKEKLFIKSSDTANGIQLLTIHKAKGLEFNVVMMPFANWKYSYGVDSKWVQTDAFPEQEISKVYLPMTKALESSEIAASLSQSKEDNYLDNLNLLYVATTRAVSELYMIIDDDSSKKSLLELSSINQFLNRYLKWNGATSLEFGLPTTAEVKREDQEATIQLPIRSEAFGQVGVVVNNRASVIWSEEVRDKIDFGSVVHSLLESISNLQEILPTVYQAIAQGIITESQQQEVEDILTTVVTHNNLQDYFQLKNKVLAEQSIITPEGNEYIPDRIAFDDNEKTVKLLDFKTGKPKNAHQNQLELYASLLEKMNYQVVEKIIVYLQPFKIISA